MHSELGHVKLPQIQQELPEDRGSTFTAAVVDSQVEKLD
jgi:hypothetical protein